MKKVLTMFLATTLLLALAACGNTTDPVDPVDDTNEFPTLTGVESSVTVQVGDVFDPFAGVTASDPEDGDITADITIDNLECLGLGTDNVVPATAGGASCTLVYKVLDSEGAKAQKNSTVTVEVVVDATENALVNGDFSLGSNGWANTDGSLVDLYNDAVGTVEVVDGALVVTVTNPSWDGSAPRVNQEGIDFVNGTTYEVSLDAKANVAGISMKSQVGVLLPADPWFTPYYYNADGAYTFDLTTEFQTFTYKFTVTEATTDNGTITLEFGGNEVGDADFVFTLDNIVIKESTPDPDSDAPVFSGLADTIVGLEDTFDALDGVSFYDVDTTLTNADIVVTHDGGANVTMENGLYSFAELGTYTFTYVLTDADGNTATETRTVTVEAMVYEQPYELVGGMSAVADEDSVMITYPVITAQFWADIALLDIDSFDGAQESITFNFTGVDTHTYLFKVEFATASPIEQSIVADGTAQSITLDLSGLTAEERNGLVLFAFFCTTEGATGTVDIENVTYDQIDYTEEWVGYGGFTSVAGFAGEVVSYEAIGAQWWTGNAQLTVADFDGTKDSITFSFLGELDQEYMIKVENGALNIETFFTGTGAMQDVVVDLSGWTEADRDALNLFILFVPEEGAEGSITTYGWDYTPENPALWAVYGNLTVTRDEDSDLISYPGSAFAWDNNAQQSIVFDGTNNALDLTVVGTAGHTYKLKIEKTGGHSTEVDFTATGSEEVVQLDLSGFTEAERSELSLLVIFVMTPDEVGTLDVIGWAPGTVTVVEPTTDWVGYGGFSVVAGDSKEVVSYTGISANWWEGNAQLPVTGFDGTKTSITFSFLGELDQTYLIKVENGALNIETFFTGTGAMQDVTVDLSGWTEADRAAMNLFILFVNEEGAEGSIDVYGWDYTPAS